MSEGHVCPVTLKNRSSSVIAELVQGLMGMHVWVKFEEAGPKTSRVILMTKIQTDGRTKLTLYAPLRGHNKICQQSLVTVILGIY